jgi:hypothetical protein
MTLWLAIWTLAVMRVTRLINFDTIMDWLHNWVGNKFGPGSWQAEFFMCPWCIGMWVSLASAWFPIWKLEIGWAWYVPLALAASMITGLLARFSAEETAMEPLEDKQP